MGSFTAVTGTRDTGCAGDVITDKAAKELGMQSMLITSGRESVKEAFHQAKQMYRLYKEATAEQRLFREMIDQESKGMLIIDQHNQLYFINQQMKEWTEKGLFAPFTSHVDVMAWCPALEPAVKTVREGKQSGYSQISFQQQVWHVKGSLLSKGELLLTIEKPSAVINREGSVYGRWLHLFIQHIHLLFLLSRVQI